MSLIKLVFNLTLKFDWCPFFPPIWEPLIFNSQQFSSLPLSALGSWREALEIQDSDLGLNIWTFDILKSPNIPGSAELQY